MHWCFSFWLTSLCIIGSIGNDNSVCETAKETQMYRTVFWTLWEREKKLKEESEIERFYEDLQDLLELTLKKDVLFIIGDWNAKVRSQEILE